MKNFCDKVICVVSGIFILFFSSSNICSAQVSGDYESNGTGGGTWNVATSWLTYNGISYVAAVAAPSTSLFNIIIQPGDAVTVSSNETLGANVTDNGTLNITGTLICGTDLVLGTGSFILNSGATLNMGSLAGISTTAATGNIQVTGVKTFSAAANYTYSGAIVQVTGNALPATLTGAISFTNTNASGTSLSNNIIINSPGTATVTGALACNTFVISGTGSFTLNLGSTLLTANAAGISATGASGSIQTTVIGYNTGSDYIYYGNVAQVTGTGLPSTIVSLTINNSSIGGVNLTDPVTLTGNLNLTNGIFCLNANTLTLPSGRTIVRQKGSLSLCAGTLALLGTVNVNYTGTTPITTGPEIPSSTTALGNLTINGTGATITLGANVTVNGNLTMTTGTLQLGGFTLTYSVASQLIYNGTTAQTVGVEWPSSSFSNNISVSNNFVASGVTLDANKTNFTATLTVISPGFFNSGVFSLAGTGNIAINAGGTLITPNVNGVSPSGAIQLTGTRTFATKSCYTFNGTVLQVTGVEMPATVANLTIKNSSGIQLTNTVIVSNNLNMTQGNIDLNGKSITLGTTAALPGTLTYTSGTLINTGTFTRWFATSTIAAGNVAGLFPVGTATDYRPFNVSIPTAPTTGGTISVTYTDATTTTTTSFADGASTVIARRDLNWGVTTSTLAGGTFNLEISGTGYGIIANVTDLRLTLIGSVVGSPGINAGTTSNPQVNRTGLTAANLTNTFYLGSVNTSSPLPVTLISFTARVQNNEVALNWSTAQEINFDYFTIQRSKDIAVWESIEKISGSASNGNVNYYSGYDPAPYKGISYYRLMQTDLDGKWTYSFVRPVNLGVQVGISVYPNPAINLITINFSQADKYQVIIFNNSGQLMIAPVVVNGNRTSINVLNYPDGIYFIQVNHGSDSETFEEAIRK
jgi:Secretion system C-terminal sorting domain